MMISQWFRPVVLTLVVAVSWLFVYAQVAYEQPLPDTTRLENALLWKITPPDSGHAGYLFGTIHLIGREDFFLPPGTENALLRCGRIVFEIDLADMMDLGKQLSIFARAFMRDGVRLKDLVAEEDYKLVESHFAGLGLPMFMLDRIKPMFLTVFASMDTDIMGGEMTSYEMEFYELAKERDMPTGGLETMDFQLAIFDSIPYADQAAMLVETIRSLEEGSEQLSELLGLYKAQDIETLHELMLDEDDGIGAWTELLLDSRNKRWIDGIREFLSVEPVFFAVGAGHLAGPKGVIWLLREAGFIVVPVLEAGGRIEKF